jgi:hypothetical protein
MRGRVNNRRLGIRRGLGQMVGYQSDILRGSRHEEREVDGRIELIQRYHLTA